MQASLPQWQQLLPQPAALATPALAKVALGKAALAKSALVKPALAKPEASGTLLGLATPEVHPRLGQTQAAAAWTLQEREVLGCQVRVGFVFLRTVTGSATLPLASIGSLPASALAQAWTPCWQGRSPMQALPS